MASTVGDLRAILTLDSSQYTKGLSQAQSEAQGFGKVMDGLGSAAAGAAKAGALAFTALGAAVTSYAVAQSQTYVKAVQFEQALELVGQQMGVSNDQIQEQIRGMTKLGASNQNARETVMALMKARLDVAGATELYARAEDIAVTSGKTGNEVIQGLIHGITTQNALVLRNAGVTIDADKAMKDYAATLGKSVDKLSAQEKQQAYLNAVMAETNGIAGVAQKQTEGLVFNWAALQRPMSNLAELMGSLVEPAMSAVGKAIFDLINAFVGAAQKGGALYPVVELIRDAAKGAAEPLAYMVRWLSEWIKNLKADDVRGFIDAIRPFAPVLGALAGAAALAGVSVGANLSGPIGALLKPLSALPWPIWLIVGAIGGLLLVSPELRQALMNLLPHAVKLGKGLWELLAPALKEVGKQAAAAVDGMTKMLEATDNLAKALEPVDELLRPMGGLTTVVGKAFGFLAQALGSQIVGPIYVGAAALNFFAQAIKGLFGLAEWFGNTVIKPIVGFFQWLYNMLVGGSIIPDLVNGIIRWFTMLPGKLWEVMQAIWNAVVATWNSISEFIGGVVGAIWSTIVNTWWSIWGALSEVSGGIWQTIVSTWNSISETLTAIVQGIWTTLVNTWNSLWSTLDYITSGIWGTLTTWWNFIWQTLTSIVQGIWSTITTWWNSIWSTIESIMQGIWGTLSSWWNYIWSTITSINQGIWYTLWSWWTTIWQTITDIITGIWNTLNFWWNTIWQTITMIVQGIWNTLWYWWTEMWTTITNITMGMWQTLVYWWDVIGAYLYEKWETIRSWAVEKFTAIHDQVTELLYSLRDNVAEIMNTTASWFGERLNWIIDHINSFGKLVKGGLQAFGINIPDINIGPIQFAKGGVVDRPTFAMVGEAGRESIIPWDPRRRKEARQLWEKTGIALGMFGDMAMGGPGGSLGNWWMGDFPMTQGPGGGFSHGGMQAWDYSMPNNTPIYLGLPGTVIPGPGGGYGESAGINLDAGGSIVLGHLVPGSVNVGKHEVGTQIALSDNTGFSTGPHMHFEVRGTQLSPGPGGGEGGGGGFDLMAKLREWAMAEVKKWQERAKVPVGGIMFGEATAEPGWAKGWLEDILIKKSLPGFFKWLMDNFGSKLKSMVAKAFGTDAWSGDGTFEQWARQAMEMTGVDESWLKGLDIIAKHESNYNPNAANNWDSNAARGDPSRGIMQTIGATFRAHAVAGCEDIFNPVCNIAAAINYIKARYGHVNNTPGVKSFLSGGRYTNYDRGGMLPPGVGPINDSGRSEAVLSNGTFGRLLSVLDRLDQALGGRHDIPNLTVNNNYEQGVTSQEIVGDLMIALRTL